MNNWVNNTINSKNLLYKIVFLFFSVFMIISLSFIRTLKYDSFINIYSIFVFILILSYLIVDKKLNNNLISLSNFVVLFLIVYHLGQLITYQLGYSNPIRNNFIERYSNDTMKETLINIFTILSVTMLGLLASSTSLGIKSEDEVNFDFKNGDNLESVRILGYILLLLFFPIKLYSDYLALSSSFSGNYFDVLKINLPSFVNDLGFLSNIGMFLIILSLVENKKKGSLFIVIFVFYQFLLMLSGGRGQPVLLLVILFYIIHKSYRSINWKNILFVMVFLFLLSAFATTIADIRNYSGWSIEDFWNLFMESFKENPILDFIDEMGGTIQTTYATVQKVPNQIPYGHGKTFLYSFFTIIPNIGGFLDPLIPEIEYQTKLQLAYIGGSYVGEIYYNFGAFGYIFAFLVGLVVQKISYYAEKILVKKNMFSFAVVIPIFMYTMWWARGNFASIIRVTIWTGLVLWILKKILYLLSSKK